MTNAIILENVSFKYQNRSILEDVNLKIKENDFIGIIGPNGGGKTTLIKLIIGLLKPSSGKITTLSHDPIDVRSSIGYVPQVTNVDRDFPITLFDLVLLGAISKKLFGYSLEIKEKVNYILNEMNIYHLKNKPFGSLSGGEAQKALIARALICDPKILALDEPTANIDMKSEQKILDLISKNKETTILMVSHDLEIIINKAKKIIFVQKNVSSRLPEEVCEHFALGLYHKPYLEK
jgi:zinc transport system ATP-binding protein